MKWIWLFFIPIVFSQVLNEEFKVCNERLITQYYRADTHYIGQQKSLKEYYKTNYIVPEKSKNQNGYIRIRFVVNCKGLIGRFDVLESDLKFKPFNFDPQIREQLLELTKSLSNWSPGLMDGKAVDSFYFLTFKLIDGRIHEILP